jgi:hypothetical protein
MQWPEKVNFFKLKTNPSFVVTLCSNRIASIRHRHHLGAGPADSFHRGLQQKQNLRIGHHKGGLQEDEEETKTVTKTATPKYKP